MSDPHIALEPTPDRRAGERPGERWRRLRSLRPGHGPGPDESGIEAAPAGGAVTGADKAQRRWTAVGVVLTSIGSMAALFLVYVFAFTPLTHARGQHSLLQTLVQDKRQAAHLATGAIPPDGSPVGMLTIPAIGVREVMISGTSAADLENGPGLLRETAVPGAPGNAVVAARRVTFGGPFGSIAGLSPGDRLMVLDGLGKQTFRVVSVKVVSSGATVTAPESGHSWLSLVTQGSGFASSSRVVVLSKLVGLPEMTKRPSGSPPGDPSASLAFPGQASALLFAGAWFLAFLAGLALAIAVGRRWDQPAVIYLFAAPVLLAFGLLVCENLVRVLPATL
jgi:sortase A